MVHPDAIHLRNSQQLAAREVISPPEHHYKNKEKQNLISLKTLITNLIILSSVPEHLQSIEKRVETKIPKLSSKMLNQNFMIDLILMAYSQISVVSKKEESQRLIISLIICLRRSHRVQ